MAFGYSRNSSSGEEQRGRSIERSAEPIPLMERKQRTNSYSSELSTESSASATPKTSSSWFKPAPQSANVNVYSTCGRHTNQFLFGGPSLIDLARAMLSKD
ncbi:hypothetical protein FSARC_3060 [Fusarium sarcochroum]|uniref:Uncharacterized protein n=1 Tax=Fusarium sarcochroum TaxID=1208366 RepID=A0A8H4XC73_9HYPO|nr:hypothetical protein FSARC_3060 [Fusarium sarcochroum]